MKRLVLILLCFTILPTATASADWRWAPPKFKQHKVKPVCDSYSCHHAAKVHTRANYKVHVKYYNARKLNEWKMWISLPIPDCTWNGESGTGPEYAKIRYTMPNADGSGAYGKFQFMPKTYVASGKYDDWSPLDQEIAVRHEYWKHGVTPWTNCTS